MARYTFLLVTSFSTLAGGARAQLIVPTSQDRFIEAEAILGLGGGPTDYEFIAAPDLGPFIEQADARVSDPAQGLLADAGAAQDSFITSDRVRTQGSYFATVENAFTEASSTNHCEFEFTVTQDAVYSLSGSIYAYDFGQTSVSLTSTTGSPNIFGSFALGFSSDFSFDLSGFLPAGDYRWRVRGSGWVQDGSPYEYASGGYNFDLNLTPPTPADCVPTANTTGQPAILALGGEHRVGSIETYYGVSQGPPNSFGILFYGAAAPPTPFGSGVLCVSTPQYRVPGIKQFDAGGMVNGDLPYFLPPLNGGPGQIQPGSTWTFQFWFRDVTGTATPWNTSSAVSVTFE